MKTKLVSDRVTTLLKTARRAGGNSLCWLAVLMFADQPTMAAQGDEAKPAGVSAVWGVIAKRVGLKEPFFFVDDLSGVPERSQTDSLRVRQVAGSAPANMLWPGEDVTVTVQLVNLTDQPIRSAGKVDVIPYGLTTSPEDMFNVAIRQLGESSSVPVAVDIPAKGFQDVNLRPAIPEPFGAYALILELPGHERLFVASLARTLKNPPLGSSYRLCMDIVNVPALQRLGTAPNRVALQFGWPKGPVNAIKLWNEPWEGISIACWGADMLRFREISDVMIEAVEEARKEGGVQVMLGGCDSSANTFDKYFPDGNNRYLKALDFISIHYQGLSPVAGVKEWVNRKGPDGQPSRVKIWDGESWCANSDDRIAGTLAAMYAAGHDRLVGIHSQHVVASERSVEVRTTKGSERRNITQAWPVAPAVGALQHFIGNREFDRIVFQGLPWVFAFKGVRLQGDSRCGRQTESRRGHARRGRRPDAGLRSGQRDVP